jgi:hypothetical protein
VAPLDEGGDWGRGILAASSPLLPHPPPLSWGVGWCLDGVCGWGGRESESEVRRDASLPPPLVLLLLLLILLLRSEPLAAVEEDEAICSLSLLLVVLLVSGPPLLVPPLEAGVVVPLAALFPLVLEFCCCEGSLGGSGAGAFWAICA